MEINALLAVSDRRMKKISIFFHCLFYLGEPPEMLLNACQIIRGQMDAMRGTGLLDAASELIVGINGGKESDEIANLILPAKAQRVLHGMQCRNECRTLVALEKWLPGHEDWYVLYLHAKGSTHPADHQFSRVWRNCMMNGVVTNWRTCVADLDAGNDAVGSHWMIPPATPPGQHIFAGNFWWARAAFLLTLPSILKRDRIKVSGLDSIESRYEAEVWLGNGPRVLRVKDYHGPGWNPSKMQTCAENCYEH